MTGRPPARVALVGLNGHGRWHLDNIDRLRAEGIVELVAAADPAPIDPATTATLHRLGAPLHASLAELLAQHHPDIVVLVTPPASHLTLASTALAAGADVLLEKPATVHLADLATLTERARAADRLCQVGFQALGSAAPAHLPGLVGGVRAVAAVGAWWRPGAYFSRARWAGRRFVDGVAVGDGALTNAFGHAVMAALEVAGAGRPEDVTGLEAELFHANPIEAEDTASLRLRVGDVPVTVAVTLCADRVIEPYLLATGPTGTARWDYTTDALASPTGPEVALPPRRDLLANLVQARVGAAELICPPSRCTAFTAVIEQLLAIPVAPIPPTYLDGDTDVTLPGGTDLVESAARAGQHLSAVGAPWAPR